MQRKQENASSTVWPDYAMEATRPHSQELKPSPYNIDAKHLGTFQKGTLSFETIRKVLKGLGH